MPLHLSVKQRELSIAGNSLGISTNPNFAKSLRDEWRKRAKEICKKYKIKCTAEAIRNAHRAEGDPGDYLTWPENRWMHFEGRIKVKRSSL